MSKICPECHHNLSCQFNGMGNKCYCSCHDLANDAAELWLILAKMTGEAISGTVFDSTARKAGVLLQKHNNAITDKLVRQIDKRI